MSISPQWALREKFAGEMLHAGAYRKPEPFSGGRVLVVGPGCSGMEIAYDVAKGGAAKVWLSARTPPNIVLRQGPGGLPGDMLALVLLRLPARVGDAVARLGRRMDLGDLTAYGVVICATGYRRALEPLVGHLGALDGRGMPRAVGAHPAARGLRFIGYVPRPGGLGYMSKEATRAARAIARELRAYTSSAAVV